MEKEKAQLMFKLAFSKKNWGAKYQKNLEIGFLDARSGSQTLRHDKMISEFLTKNKDIEKLIVLSEKNAIIVNKKEIQVIGQEPAIAISSTFRKIINMGEKI